MGIRFLLLQLLSRLVISGLLLLSVILTTKEFESASTSLCSMGSLLVLRLARSLTSDQPRDKKKPDNDANLPSSRPNKQGEQSMFIHKVLVTYGCRCP